MTAAASTRSREEVINVVLAQLLRDRLGLSTAAETIRGPARPDIVLRRPEGPVVLEIEFEPAATVDADALARLGLEIDGQPVQIAAAVAVPVHLRAISQQHLYERLAGASLTWREWRIDGTAGPRVSGSFVELGNAAARAAPPASNLEEAVKVLDDGVRSAGSRLYSSPGTLARVAGIFNAPPSDEVAHMAALVVTNAMVFQERLSSVDAAIQPTSASRRNGVFSRLRLLTMWDAILDIDYYPIFSMARDVVSELSDVEAAAVLEECAETAAQLLGMGAVGRHDLAGRIFNRLIADRKLLAAYYTSIPAATLLAGLALAPERWPSVDWSDAENLSQLRVVDPACGTGTLLMAAYQQIVQNRATAPASVIPAEAGNQETDEALHQALVEHTLFGADVVQAAIHLTAATLAAMSPSVGFTQMQLHSLRMGMERGASVFDATEQGFEAAGVEPEAPSVSQDVIHLGSLDWLQAPVAQSSFSATREQIGAKGGAGDEVRPPRADLVISNPPFTRRGSDGGKGAALARVLDLPAGDAEAQQAVARRTSDLIRGTPANQTAGHGASFTVLADRLVKPGGRVALVLPVTALAGESWRDVRQMLADRYLLEFVVSSHDPKLRSMSYDTDIAEALVVARRLREDETPSGRGRFVNLWRAPYRDTDALALVNAINVAAEAPLHRSDGPPIGGIPLIVGGEQWGELLDGPVDARSWAASRWRQGQTGQFAAALERGELWAADGSRVIAQLPIEPLGSVCNVGPQDRQIRGSLGAFDAYHGWDAQAQFPALWAQSQKVHQGFVSEPNARLYPSNRRDHPPIWSQAGMLQMTRDVRYNSQRIMATRTIARALGVSQWFSMKIQEGIPANHSRQEVALALWCNSTAGLMLHANHASRSQYGRGRGNKGMLETLPTLDVRELQPWQLDEAQSIWRDFQGRTFESFHRCAVDPDRIDLDQRITTDMLALDDQALTTISRLRTLLASDPSIHGAKEPELPS